MTRLSLLLALPLLALATACAGISAGTDPAPTIGDTHPALFYNEQLFARAVRAAESGPDLPASVAGGIIPHHWLAGYMITSFFRGLAASDPPRTIVLLGPNHDNEGAARVLTSDLPWATPFGVVEPDDEWVRDLVSTGVARIEPPVLTTEHSVAGIMPAISYYLPHARVVPLILAGDLGPDEARRLGDAIAAHADADTVVVAAVDFSHYLVSSEAERRDAVTLDVLRADGIATLYTFGNDYLDSPPSIAVLIAAMERLHAGPFVLLDHNNSGTLAEDELLPTTSYFLGYYPAAAASASHLAGEQPASGSRLGSRVGLHGEPEE